MKQYLKSCSNVIPHCCFCETELIDDVEWNEKWNNMGLIDYEMVKCSNPNCGISFHKSNPWIYFSVDKFVKKISKPSLLDQIKHFLGFRFGSA